MVTVDGTWIFPDFALVDRRAPARRWLLEIVGFWTPEYLRTKLDRLRRAGRTDLIVCVDADRGCTDDTLEGMPTIAFRRKVDPRAVLAIIDRGEITPSDSVAAACNAPATASPRLVRIGIRDLFIDFAGRQAPTEGIHRRLAGLRVGTPVRITARGNYLFVEVDDGPVAALSGPAKDRWLPAITTIRAATIVEILDRTAEQSAPEWRSRLRVDRWRVPVVDVQVDAQLEPPSVKQRVKLPERGQHVIR